MRSEQRKQVNYPRGNAINNATVECGLKLQLLNIERYALRELIGGRLDIS